MASVGPATTDVYSGGGVSLSTLSKLESSSVSGDSVKPAYWPTRFDARSDAGAPDATTDAGAPLRCSGTGREISIAFRPPAPPEPRECDDDDLLCSHVIGQKMVRRGDDVDDVVELLELLGGCAKSGLPRVLLFRFVRVGTTNSSKQKKIISRR